MYGLNTNIDFRGINTAIPQTDDDGFTMVSVPMKTIDGAIVYNQVEQDQVRGNSALAVSLIKDKTDQFSTTWCNTIAGKLRQGTPGALDPLTLLPVSGQEANGILAEVAPASQTATTGGIPRSETVTLPDGTVARWWANQFSSTSYDLTTAAGRRGLYLDVYSKCIRGNGGMWEPDFGLISDVVWASLQASGDSNRRYVVDEEMLKLGFEQIKFNKAVLFVDRSARLQNGASGKVAFLNSKAIKLKVLEGSGKAQKSSADEGNNLKSVPVFWKHKEMSDYTSLRFNWLAYCTMNLVPKSLQDHGLATNCT